jgi:hypothetical protein
VAIYPIVALFANVASRVTLANSWTHRQSFSSKFSGLEVLTCGKKTLWYICIANLAEMLRGGLMEEPSGGMCRI